MPDGSRRRLHDQAVPLVAEQLHDEIVGRTSPLRQELEAHHSLVRGSADVADAGAMSDVGRSRWSGRTDQEGAPGWMQAPDEGSVVQEQQEVALGPVEPQGAKAGASELGIELLRDFTGE